MNFEPRQLVHPSGGGVATVSLVTGNRQASHYEDSGNVVISGVVTLLSGAKYNVNGTWAANTVFGKTRAVYLCRGASMQAANDLAEGLYDLAGRSGTLSAVEYTAGGVATHTCNVVVEAARPLTMLDRVGAVTGKQHSIQVEVIFDRLTDWS